MADENETTEQQEQQEQQQEQTDSKAEQSTGKSLIGRVLPWLILALVVFSCAGAGFGLGRLFAGSQEKETVKSASAASETDELAVDDESAEGSEKTWYYDLDPVVANLNEPSVTRYVRATFTLEMSADVDQKKGAAFLDEKKPVLINWLTVYLSSLSLDDIRGDKNLKSIQSRVREAFNETLFPDSKPQIEQVLIKEFPVQ